MEYFFRNKQKVAIDYNRMRGKNDGLDLQEIFSSIKCATKSNTTFPDADQQICSRFSRCQTPKRQRRWPTNTYFGGCTYVKTDPGIALHLYISVEILTEDLPSPFARLKTKFREKTKRFPTKIEREKLKWS